jgi:hypothetical protein
MKPIKPPGPITRESWLEAAVKELAPIFTKAGHTIPACRVSCGFASTGARSGHIGQCWSTKSSKDGVNQIFISPALEDAVEVLDTLVHELVHAVDDCKHKHGKEFKKIATSLGMVGPMRSAGAGPVLKEKLKELATKLGAYPHARLSVPRKAAARSPRPRAKCSKCGFTVPMLKDFLHYGPPICPKDRIDMEAVGDWEIF